MATGTEISLRFTPSRVEGVAAIAEVAVFTDRLELLSEGEPAVVRFLDIARWDRHAWLWRPLAHLGWIRGNPCVADRDWFHPPVDRFFRFYAEPAITVFMPDETGVQYPQTKFFRTQAVIWAGGFTTYDLG